MNIVVNNRQFMGDSATADTVVGKILSFLTLPDKWCYGYGRPSKLSSVVSALTLLSELRSLGYGRFEAFPDPAGYVLLSAFCEEISIEILCKGNDQFDVMIELTDAPEESLDNVNLDVVLNKIRELSCIASQKSSDFYIQAFTVSRNIDLQAQHSKTMTGAYPLWTHYAFPQQGPIYASTSLDFTQTQLGTLQCFGGYQPTLSPLGWFSNEPVQKAGTTAIATSSGWLTTPAGSGSNQSQFRISRYARGAA